MPPKKTLPEGEINLIKSKNATKEEIDEYIKLVWEDTEFGADTPWYLREFDTAPTDKITLDKLHNAQIFKHGMLEH